MKMKMRNIYLFRFGLRSRCNIIDLRFRLDNAFSVLFYFSRLYSDVKNNSDKGNNIIITMNDNNNVNNVNSGGDSNSGDSLSASSLSIDSIRYTYDRLDSLLVSCDDKKMLDSISKDLVLEKRKLGNKKDVSNLLKDYGITGYVIVKDFVINYMPWEFKDNKDVIDRMLTLFLNNLDKDVVYKCIMFGILDNRRIVIGGYSFYISKNTTVDYLYHLLYRKTLEAVEKYRESDEVFTSWKMGVKKWLSREDYKDAIDKIALLTQKLNESSISVGYKKIVSLEEGGYRRMVNNKGESKLKEIAEFKSLKNSDCIFERVIGSLYGVYVGENNDWKFYDLGEYKLCVSKKNVDKRCNSVRVVVVDKLTNVELYSWVDTIISGKELMDDFKYKKIIKDKGARSILDSYRSCNNLNDVLLIRVIDNSDKIYLYDMVKGEIISRNIRYNVSYIEDESRDYEYNNNIGALDFETYRIEDGEDEGRCIPYACGFMCDNGMFTYYINEGESSYDLILRMLNDLVTRENDGKIFYVHNLSGFDHRLMLSTIGKFGGYNVRPLGKGLNEIFYLKISRVIKGKHISVFLKDSQYFLSSSLKSLGNSFKVETHLA